MEIFFEYGSIQSNPLYNCSSRTVKEWEKLLGEPRPVIGYSMLIFGIFIEILYFMCLTAIVKLKLLEHSCYKIMFLLGVTDMFVNLICSMLAGYLFIEGAVFCSHPNIIFISGALAMGGWAYSCALTIILVINRIVDVLFPLHNKTFFAFERTWYICLIPLINALYFIFISRSILFNSRVMAWLEDPQIYPNSADKYYNKSHFVHNVGFSALSMVLYSIYFVAVIKRQKKGWTTLTRNIFIQSSMIFVINCSAALIYAILIYLPASPWVVLIGELDWSLVHGTPAIIYIVMNQKIKMKILSWFVKPKPKSKLGASSTFISS